MFQGMEERQEPTPPRRRLIMIAVSATVALGGLFLVLVLGTLGYDVRRTSLHDARLRGVLRQKPTVYQVTVGLQPKAPLIDVVENQAELQNVVERWGGGRGGEILEKAALWSQLRVFAERDMMYFIYFDDQNIMRDYVYVSR